MRERRNPLVTRFSTWVGPPGGYSFLLELQTSKIGRTIVPKPCNEAIDRAIEVIRNRIDQFGLSEPLIVRQGRKWIVVQMPGVKEPGPGEGSHRPHGAS
jgi:preprotein translocase subunit SecD